MKQLTASPDHEQFSSVESDLRFECPSCSEKFSEPKELQDHIENHHEQVSRLSLVSDTGSDSWMQIRVPCKSCDMSFENEAFLSEHHTKVHATLEELGIKRLQIYSKRIKQKFTGLEINEEGSIVLDESEEEYVAKNYEGLMEKNTCLKRNL